MNENKKRLFTSESTGAGHPDVIASLIAARILDACLMEDKNSRCGIEVLVCRDTIVLAGEIRTSAQVDFEEVALATVKSVGYINDGEGFCYLDVQILNFIQEQSDEIHAGVDKGDFLSLGYGDQGIMFGYAESITKEHYPLAISIANRLTEVYGELLLDKKTLFLEKFRPDVKSQVTIDLNTSMIDTIILAISHAEKTTLEEIQDFAVNCLIPRALGRVKLSDGRNALALLTKDTKIFVNTAGKFTIHGPASDTGVTGRKLAVDSYGGSAHLGGGFICGKDYTKSDNSLAKGLRYLAKHLIEAQVADAIEIQAATAIGQSKPVSLYVNTFGTNLTFHSDDEIAEILEKNVDLSLTSVIQMLDLKNSRSAKSAANGVFGRPYEKYDDGTHCFSWEKIDTELVQKFICLFR